MQCFLYRPAFGNDDDSVDSIAVKIVTDFHAKLQSRRMYRDATPTLSVLTITSNVMYGANTGRLSLFSSSYGQLD